VSLISVAELAAALDDPDLRIADVRWSLAAPGGGRAAYATAHLPGAVFVDLESVLTAPVGPGRHPLPDPAAFAAALGALGIGRRHRVVAYDDAGGTVAARLWWMLDALGHPRAAVLNGGIGAWRAAGLPVATEMPLHAALPPEEWLAAVEPRATPGVGSAWPRTIDRVALAARLGGVTLLDARAPERYRGEIEPIDRVPGHIPTAHSLPTSALLDAGGRFLAPAALAARFAILGTGDAAGAGTGEIRSVVLSCGSGVNACHLALAMRAAGLPDPLLYPGSYSDWTQSGMPIATGDAPGEPPASIAPDVALAPDAALAPAANVRPA
jgi:thiosulfate/3-mercaptopyruvate sulfurtransferase